MAQLKPINGWIFSLDSLLEDRDKGKYCNEQGRGLNGIYRREYKSYFETVFIRNGHIRCSYKYPKFEIPFKSPMVRWENLWHCGGFILRDANGNDINDDNIVQDVVTGLKPIGFVSGTMENINRWTNLANEHDCIYSEPKEHSLPAFKGQYEIGIANNCTVSEYFDIEALLRTYRNASEVLGFSLLKPFNEEIIRRMGKHRLSDYLQGWDYAYPINNVDYVKTGLLLGYAVESTIECVIRQGNNE